MSVWKPIATATGCTALLGLVAGMNIPTEMVRAAEPEWRGMVEQTFTAGNDDRPLYEAGPEDLYVPARDPMSQRVAYDAMEYMNERAVGPGPLAPELTQPSASRDMVREVMPVALTSKDIAPARTVVVPGPDKSSGIVRVVSGAGGSAPAPARNATTPVAHPEASAPLDLSEVAVIPQT